MKNLKKAILLFIIVIFFATSVFGCTQGNKNPSSSSSEISGTDPATSDSASNTTNIWGSNSKDTSNVASANIPKNLAPYEIVWYTVDNPQNDLKQVFDKVNEYTKAKFNATIKCNIVGYGDYNSKLPVLLAAGDKIDLVYTANSTLPYYDYVRKGVFLQLDDLLNKYGQGIKQVIPTDFFEGIKYKGKIFAIPTYKEKSVMWAATIYKKTVSKYNWNFSNVKTIYDLEPMFKTLKDNEPDSIPYVVGTGFSGWDATNPFESLTKFAGVYFDNHNNYKVENIYESSDYLKYITKAKEWRDLGYIAKSPDQASVKTAEASFKNGFGIYSHAPFGEAYITNSNLEPSMIVPISGKYITNFSLSGSMLAITKSSKDPDRAMMFLNLLNTDATLKRLIVHGIEGQHYVKTDNEHIKIPDGKTISGLGYSRSVFTLQNIFLNYLNSNETTNKKQVYTDYDSTAIKSKLLGFQPDPTKVMSYIASCNSVIAKYANTLELGGDPNMAADYDKFKKELASAGVAKVIDEYQKQLNEWKASKN